MGIFQHSGVSGRLADTVKGSPKDTYFKCVPKSNETGFPGVLRKQTVGQWEVGGRIVGVTGLPSISSPNTLHFMRQKLK